MSDDDKHPVLKQLLSYADWGSCTDAELVDKLPDAVTRLEAVNVEHINDSERITLHFELEKLRQLSPPPASLCGVVRLALQRMQGSAPPRFKQDREEYYYQRDETAVLENYTIATTVGALADTELGAALYGAGETCKYKPKRALSMIARVPVFASVVVAAGPKLGRTQVSGIELERLVFPLLYRCMTDRLVSTVDPPLLLERAERALAASPKGPVLVAAMLRAQRRDRRRIYRKE